MEVAFSPRGTGACPLCSKLPRCTIRKDIEKSVAVIPGGEKKQMELVIYVCPHFVETA
jgi:hypothetical protein